MSPTVTTAVPGASTSPASAAFTSTTPSTGEATTVSASCVSMSARLAKCWRRAPHFAGIGRLYEHDAIHRRGHHGIGELRIDERQAGLGARDFRPPGGDLLLAPLQLQGIRLRGLDGSERARHLSLLRAD